MTGDTTFKARRTRLSSALSLALLLGSSTAHALSISEITITSALNAPLQGVLSVELEPGEHIGEEELEVKLASPEAHARAGLPYPSMLENLRIEQDVFAGRDVRFLLSTDKPIREPIISLILEAEWNSGNLKKEVTLLLDPADYSAQLAQVSRSLATEEPVVQEVESNRPSGYATSSSNNEQPIFIDNPPAVTSSLAEAAPAKRTRPRSRRRITIENGEYGPVKRGDSLSKIAIVAARETGFTTETMMNLIYEANPEAFGGSPDYLIEGATLYIPGLEPALPQKYSKKTIVTGPPVDAPQRTVASKPRLTIVAPEGENTEKGAATGDIEKGIAASRLAENAGGQATTAGTGESTAREEELQLQVQILKNENAELQNKLSNTTEQLGNMKNELDRLVVELRALSEIRRLQESQQEPSLTEKIERWLPWLLLFITLPAALLLGTRSRKQELVVGAAPAPAAVPPAPLAESSIPAQTSLKPAHTQAKPAVAPQTAAQPTPAAAAPEPAAPRKDDTLIPEAVFEFPPEDEDESEAVTTNASDDTQESDIAPASTFSLLDDDEDEKQVEDSSEKPPATKENMPEPAAPTPPTQAPATTADEAESVEKPASDSDQSAEDEATVATVKPAYQDDTQEVIRSTLGKLEATQLINPGEMIREPESSLDATQEAEIYIAYDQFSLAEKTIKRLLKSDPDNDRYLLLQLKLFAETGQMDQLQNLSVKLLHKHPDPDSEFNQRIRSICDKAFTQVEIKKPKITPRSLGAREIHAENIDNETVLDEMTAETLFVDGIEDYIDDDTLSEEEELLHEDDPMPPLSDLEDDFESSSKGSLGSLTTELPDHLLEDISRQSHAGSPLDETGSSLLDADDAEATLSEGLDLTFDLESEIRKYESELERELGHDDKDDER